MMPRTSPGFFVGWRIESGIRYRGVLHVLDYKQAQQGNLTLSHVKSVPEKEVIFPEKLEFPLKAEYDRKRLSIASDAEGNLSQGPPAVQDEQSPVEEPPAVAENATASSQAQAEIPLWPMAARMTDL